MMNIREAAKYFGVSYDVFRRRFADKIPYTPLGGAHRRYDPADINTFKRDNQVRPPKPEAPKPKAKPPHTPVDGLAYDPWTW